MTQYDVFAIAGSADLSLELQANRVQGLSTKIGAPLIVKRPYDRPIPGLQNVEASEYRITSALDRLFHGV